MQFDAIIIGAGPSGSTAALMLARAGWKVAVVEKQPFPRRKLCGEYLSATSLPLLEMLGLADPPPLMGPQVHRGALFVREEQIVFPMPAVDATSPVCWGRSVDREQLDLLLLEAAARAGATLWQPFDARALERRAGGWICHIAGRDRALSITASLVIAASGSWQKGPVTWLADSVRRASDLFAFKAHFTDGELPEDLMPLFAFPGGYGGMVRSSRGGINLSCCIRRDALADSRERVRGRAGDAVLWRIEQSSAGVRESMGQAKLDRPWLAAGPIRPGMRASTVAGLFHVGNLAGEAHPIIAEGISMAIQSSWILCRCLIARQDEVTAGRRLSEAAAQYATRWRDHFSMRLRAAELFARLAVRPEGASLLVPLLRRFPALLTTGAKLSGKATIVDGAS